MVSRTGAVQHDDTNYGTGMVYRGNVTTRNWLGGSLAMTLVRVTDAAGKWKIQQTDGLGQLVRVIEPNPASARCSASCQTSWHRRTPACCPGTPR